MTEKQVLNLGNFSADAQDTFLNALIVARERFKYNFLGPEHFLWSLINKPETNGYGILNACGVNLEMLRRALNQALRVAQTTTSVEVVSGSFSLPLSVFFTPILNRARTHAGRNKIGTDHLLLAMTEVEPVRSTLRLAGITENRVRKAYDQIHQKRKAEPAQTLIIDLIELVHGKTRPPFVARQAVVDTLLTTLLDQNEFGAILMGEAGSARWLQILGLADTLRKIGKRRRPFGLIAINPKAYLDNPILTMQEAVAQAQKTRSVLVVPNLHLFLERSLPGYLDAGELLIRALVNGEAKLVGLATPPNYTQNLERHRVFGQLQKVQLEPATVQETLEILKALAPSLAKEQRVQLEAADLEKVVDLAYRFLPGVLPGKAIDLFSAACAEVRRANLVGAGDGIVDEVDLAVVVERQTGIPVGKTLGPEQARLAQMEEEIHWRYINQDHAVTAVCRAVRHGRTAFKDQKRPIGTFLFLGPTGVGKTELGKALAEFLFGSEDALVVINMTEFEEEHTVSALLGAPHGYVGFGERTQLDIVREKPYSVVLLDEFGKAHSKVQQAFMQALEEGFLTDRKGNRIDFRNTVLIMTTNVGTEFLKGKDFEREGQLALQAVKAHFRLEFLNRIDAQIVFRYLTRENLVEILKLMLGKTIKEAQQEGLTLVIEPNKLTQIVQVLEPLCNEYGARPLRRAVDTLEQTIVDQLMRGEMKPGDTLDILLQDGKIAPQVRS